MPLLPRRAVQPLLNIVGGKRHANSENRDEDGPTSAAAMTEEDINAPPMSSDDEALKSTSETPPEGTMAKTTKRTKNIHAVASADEGKRRRQRPIIRPPRQGSFQSGRADNERDGSGEEEKENNRPAFAKKKRTYQAKDMFGMEHASSMKRQRVQKTFGSKNKLEQSSAGSNKTSTKPRSSGSGSSANVRRSKAPVKKSLQSKAVRKQIPIPDVDEEAESDCSMLSLDLQKSKDQAGEYNSEPDENLEEVVWPKSKNKKSSKPLRHRPNLSSLDAYKLSQRSNTKSSASKPATLPDLDPLHSGSSTPLSSVPSECVQEQVEDLEQYLAENPTFRDADDRCPLCDEEVEQEYYWEFWKGKKQSVRNQSVFCRQHKKIKAAQEYEEKGYPEVDWDALPKRIEELQPHLVGILKNDVNSYYRHLHEDKIREGVHKVTVNDFLHNVDTEDESAEAIPDSLTGYYGARGARVIASLITTQVAKTMREYQDDKVVAYGGVGYFVQRVLVPECTSRLIMEDMEVSEGMARTVLEESGAVGRLVHEELGDDVVVNGEEVVDDDDDDE